MRRDTRAKQAGPGRIQHSVQLLTPDFKRLWPAVAFDGVLAGATVGGVVGVAYALLMICSGGVTLAGFVVLPIAGAVIGVQVGVVIGAFVGLLAAALLLSMSSRCRADTAAVVATVEVLVVLVAAELLIFGPAATSSYWTYAVPGLAAAPLLLSVWSRAHQYAARMVAA
jgi:hypothetical protein